MPQLTLLEMTQDILSSMSSDEVSSISDTVESLQVAKIVRNKYYDIITRTGMPENKELFQFTASGDSTKPTLMYMPSQVGNIEWVKYFDSNTSDAASGTGFHAINEDIEVTSHWATSSTSSVLIGTGSKTFTVEAGLEIAVSDSVVMTASTNSMFGTVTSYSSTTLVVNVTSVIGSGTYASWIIASTSNFSIPGYLYVTPLPQQQFLDHVHSFNPADTSTVGSFLFTEGSSTFTFYYKLGRQPTYYTVLENYYILFDSYDDTQDSTLQASKTLVYGTRTPTFTLSDAFTPDLDDNKFALLLNEAKAWAFYELKQQPHQLAMQETKRQWNTLQRNKSINGTPTAFSALPSFGRRRNICPI